MHEIKWTIRSRQTNVNMQCKMERRTWNTQSPRELWNTVPLCQKQVQASGILLSFAFTLSTFTTFTISPKQKTLPAFLRCVKCHHVKCTICAQHILTQRKKKVPPKILFLILSRWIPVDMFIRLMKLQFHSKN